MKKLFLMRHAHAEPEAAPTMGDHERVLSPEGQQEVLKTAAFMKKEGFVPDCVLSSSSARTFQTAHILFGQLFNEEGMKIKTSFDRKLYLATPDRWLENIRNVDEECECLLVIGHNPGIGELAQKFSRDELLDFPTCAFAAFESTANWQDFETSKVKLKKSFVP